jgi:hypothetical protein
MSKQSITVALFAAIFLMAASITNAQSTQKKTEQKKSEDVEDEAQIQKSVLLSNLSALDVDALNLNSPLARAVVKTEIADVAWNLDKQWARQLLKDAFELALPDKEMRRRAKDGAIAMDLLGQAISAANASDVKRTAENSYRVEFDNKAFELLALNYEGQTFQMAKSLDDRLHRSLALAAIYRRKSNALLKK